MNDVVERIKVSSIVKSTGFSSCFLFNSYECIKLWYGVPYFTWILIYVVTSTVNLCIKLTSFRSLSSLYMFYNGKNISSLVRFESKLFHWDFKSSYLLVALLDTSTTRRVKFPLTSIVLTYIPIRKGSKHFMCWTCWHAPLKLLSLETPSLPSLHVSNEIVKTTTRSRI